MTVKITEEQLNKIAEMTDNNQHGEVLGYIAKIVKKKNYEKIFYHINEIHTIEGYIPTTLLKYRNEQKDELFGYIKSELGMEIFDEINSQL